MYWQRELHQGALHTVLDAGGFGGERWLVRRQGRLSHSQLNPHSTSKEQPPHEEQTADHRDPGSNAIGHRRHRGPVGYVRSAKDKAVADEALVDVYVVDKLVPKGAESETIKSSVSIEHVPSRLKQSGAITDLDAVGTNVAATDLQPGDQLLAARLVPKDKVSEEVTDKVQISTLLAAERAVGGSLQKGDLVGVYLSFDPFDLDDSRPNPRRRRHPKRSDHAISTDCDDNHARSAEEVPEHEPAGVPARARHQRADDGRAGERRHQGQRRRPSCRSRGSQYVVTLALSPEQSERFVFATEFGHVWLSNDPATVSDDGTRLVTLGNVYTVVK